MIHCDFYVFFLNRLHLLPLHASMLCDDWLPYSTYLYFDFFLCSMTKLKEQSRKICYLLQASARPQRNSRWWLWPANNFANYPSPCSLWKGQRWYFLSFDVNIKWQSTTPNPCSLWKGDILLLVSTSILNDYFATDSFLYWFSEKVNHDWPDKMMCWFCPDCKIMK